MSSSSPISASREIEEFIRLKPTKTKKNALPWTQTGHASVQQPYTLTSSGTVSVEIRTRQFIIRNQPGGLIILQGVAATPQPSTRF